MGMDPVKRGEVYEVTVMIEGRTNWAAFVKFRKKLYEFLEDARNIDVSGPNPNDPSTKLQAREGRSGVRAKPPETA
jgi:hypothetical protein